MPTRKYFFTDDELLAAVSAEMQRLTALDPKGRAPSRTIWDVHRAKHLPSGSLLIARFKRGWPHIVESCGVTPARTYRWQDDRDVAPSSQQQCGLADDLARHVANGATPATWMDCYPGGLAYTTDAPLRTEVVRGHTADGQPCVITREYWRVR